MSRGQKNKIMVLVTSFVVFSILGFFMIHELTNTPTGPKDQEHIELRHRIMDYLDERALKYNVEKHAMKETYVLVSYDHKTNTMNYSFHNWMAANQKEVALNATIVLVDLVLKGDNDMNIQVQGGIHSRGDRLLSIETSSNDVLVIDIEGSDYLWAMKMKFTIVS
jgi:hypothetical protein